MSTLANGHMIIIEIMYDPESSEDDWEWIEIYNNGNITIDLSGYVIDDNNGFNHNAANIIHGTIAAGETAILFNDDDLDAADFEAAWGTGINLIGVTSWNRMGLNNTGDKVSLWSSFASYSGDHQTHANAIDTVDYSLTGFPDPMGSSIYLTDLNADNNIGTNWAISNDGETTPAGTGYISLNTISSNTNGNSGNDIGSPGGNFPPTLSGIPDKTLNEDSSYSFIPTANDANNDNLTFSIVNPPTWANFNTNTGELSGTPTNDHVGITSDIVISVNDGTYTVNLAAFDLTVNNTNDNPSFSSTEITEVTEDSIYSYNISTTDPDLGDLLTITARTLPSWLNFQDNGDGTATLTGTPTNNEVGTHSVELQVEDASNAVATQSFNITVNNSNDEPNFSSTEITEVTEDSIYSYNISTTDPDLGDLLTITARTLPSWLHFQNNGDGTASLTGTPTNDEVGTHSVELQVEDASNAVATQNFDIVVNNSNDTPNFSSTAVTEVTEESIYSYNISTTDPDVGDSLTITARTLPSWLHFQDNGDGRATLTGTPTNNEVGTHSVELQVQDSSTATATQSFNIVVNNNNDTPNLNDTSFDLNENAINNTRVGSLTGTDIDNDDQLTYSIIAGNNDNIFKIDSSTGEITVQDNTNLDFETTSSYILTVQVQDDGVGLLTDTANITVNIADINETPTHLSLSNSNIHEHEPIGTIIGNLSTTDQDHADFHSYSFVSGIGDTDNNKFEIIGNQLFTQASFDFETQSSYTIRVQTVDSNGLTFEKILTLNIIDIDDIPIVENAIADLEVNEDAENTIINISDVFTDLDNNNSNITKIITANSNENLVQATLSGDLLTLNYQDNHSGIAEITVQAISNGEIVTDTFTVMVNPVDDIPTVENAIADVEVNEDAENTSINISDVFTDLDNNNSNITKIITANSNENLVQATLSGDLLTLNYQDNHSGIAEITVQAISNGEIVTDTFTVMVNPVDDIPTVENAIADVEVNEDAENTSINISDVFTDLDNNNSNITKIITANSNENLVQATLSGDLLTLNYQDNHSGIAEITVQAISNGEIVTDTFKVKVNPVEEEVELIPQPIPEPKVEVQPIPEAETIPEPEIEVQPQPIPEAETIPEPEVEVQPQPILEAETIPEPEVEVQPQPEAISQLIFQQPTPTPDPLPPLPQTLFDPTLDVPSVPQISQMLTTDNIGMATTSEHLNKPTSNSDVLLMNNNEQILALESDDTVIGNDAENWINGNLGKDAIAAGGGNDTVYGGQDSDTIQGGGEDDWIYSDHGDDFVDAGEGNDSVYGGQNNDTALGGEGNDHVSGNLGNDLIEGNTGNDSLYGGQDHDTISGNIGNDEVYGDRGDDLLDGNEGNDFLNGGEGDDTLDGGEGEDQLMGDVGDDWLVGGEGNDTLTGGAGRDRFVLSFNTGLDLITDFDTEQDLLRLDASITFYDLIRTQSGNTTLIQFNDQLIAILEGVNSNLLTSENLTSLI